MSENRAKIVCFCEECLENFTSFIGRDICPICEKLKSDYGDTVEKIKVKRKLNNG